MYTLSIKKMQLERKKLYQGGIEAELASPPTGSPHDVLSVAEMLKQCWK
jgi:hypothetical protein